MAGSVEREEWVGRSRTRKGTCLRGVVMLVKREEVQQGEERVNMWKRKKERRRFCGKDAVVGWGPGREGEGVVE